jgi:hypothetical protein
MIIFDGYISKVCCILLYFSKQSHLDAGSKGPPLFNNAFEYSTKHLRFVEEK